MHTQLIKVYIDQGGASVQPGFTLYVPVLPLGAYSTSKVQRALGAVIPRSFASVLGKKANTIPYR
jgi:hypothetical protein